METIFDWLKMNDFRDVLGSKMSTGMKQKVSIARTIVHDPPVLIFDEPTSGLDVLVQRAVLQKILELRDHGQDDPLLDALDARGREALPAGGDHPQGAGSRPRGRPRSCSSGSTSPTWKSYSSPWSSEPTTAADAPSAAPTAASGTGEPDARPIASLAHPRTRPTPCAGRTCS